MSPDDVVALARKILDGEGPVSALDAVTLADAVIDLGATLTGRLPAHPPRSTR